MYALSIKQPWAALIVAGYKDVENRNWHCPNKIYGQRVLIHAGKSPYYELPFTRPTIEKCFPYPVDGGKVLDDMYERCRYAMGLGGVVGSVRITTCMKGAKSKWAEKYCTHWLLADPKPLPFFPCRGKLGVFEIDEKLIIPQEATA